MLGVSADRRELLAKLAAASEAELMRLPVDRRAMYVPMSRFSLGVDATPLGSLLVVIASAI